MKIGIIVSTDDSEHIGLARATFDEHVGFHRRDLRRLYLDARRELASKLKKVQKLEAKDDNQSHGTKN